MIIQCKPVPLILGVVAMVCFPLPAQSTQLIEFTVNDTRDLSDANRFDAKCRTVVNTCTLRAAVQQAGTLAGGHSIKLPAGTYILAKPGQFEDNAATGDLDVLVDLVIRGAGARGTIIRSSTDDRLFDVHPEANLALLDVTLQDGNVDGNGGGVQNSGVSLTIIRSTIQGNAAVGDGGGIYNGGTLTLFQSTVSRNTALNSGGGIANAGQLLIINSTLSGNKVAAFGAERGGGIRNGGSATAKLSNVTLNGNVVAGEAPVGGAIVNDSGGSVRLKMTIIANRTASACYGTITSLGHNIDSGNRCGLTGPGDLSNTDPRLGLLANNAGPTNTHALLAGSPALDAGTPVDCPAKDQRGLPRPRDGNASGSAICDIGAYEVQPPVPVQP